MPRIGLEPTRREALAPETSVSTISPSGPHFVAQRYYFFSFVNTLRQFFSIMDLILEESVVKYQQIYHCARYVGVGQIEYRAKEVVVVINQEIKPARNAIPLEQREVEHIYHLTHHKRTISLAQRGHRHRCRLGENHTIKLSKCKCFSGRVPLPKGEKSPLL